MEDSLEEEYLDVPVAPLRYPLLFDHRHYVPRLLWKVGEYQALLHLHRQTKLGVTPLIDIPEIGFDFETQEDAKSIDEHLAKVGRRLAEKWTDKWAFVDLELILPQIRMADGQHPVTFLFKDFKVQSALAIPVTGIGRDKAYQTAIRDTIIADKSGVCIRLRIEDVTKHNFSVDLASLLSELLVSQSECHLIFDLRSPNFEPVDGFAKMVLSLIRKIPDIDDWRTFTTCGTSFPQSMGQLPVGVKIIKRYEWLSYKHLLSLLKPTDRTPTFGDYAVAHPEHLRKDPRFVKPAASIRYAIDDAWYVVKGSSVRDKGTKQYIKYCADLTRSGDFLGRNFSDASDYIRKCAQRQVQPGNLTTWRRVGTNHHIEKVVADIATLTAV